MKSPRRLAWLALALALTAGSLRAQESSVFEKSILPTGFSPFRRGHDCPPIWPAPTPGTATPGTPDPGATPAERVALAAESDNPTATMFGDSGPTLRFSTIGGLAPYISKVADNASPRPLDRVYVGYNYYNNLGVGGDGMTTISGHIETIGFEKTFLDGNASFGMRLPFIQLVGRGFNSHTTGDLTLGFKYAFVNNKENGNVLSGGLSITVPTGQSTPVPSGGSINPVFFQPFVGGLYNSGDAFVHGFSSIFVPTDSRDVTVWFNDIGVGYWIYRDNTNRGMISAVAPTFEVHVSTPLNHRFPGAATDPNVVGFADIVNLTMGGTVFMRSNSSLGVAYTMPVTGPKPFNGEAIVQFNLRF
jgi:hypothetical protein